MLGVSASSAGLRTPELPALVDGPAPIRGMAGAPQRVLLRVALAAGSMLALAQATLAMAATPENQSQCFGTVGNGRIENAQALPVSGPNFQAFSGLAASLGRTHAHRKVVAVVVEAYARLQRSQPELRFVYGETGWPEGGRLRPHRTHQNGLSVDFFVPVRDAKGQSVPLPTSPFTRFGYDLEFDANGRKGELRIDFVALAEHLHALDRAAADDGIGIAQVILDTGYLPALFATPRGPSLRQRLRFMQRQAWVRHDEHYHVDFDLPCRPL